MRPACEPPNTPGSHFPKNALFERAEGPEQSLKRVKETSTLDSFFSMFWSVYPRRVAQQDALKAFQKLRVTRDLLDKMLAAIRQQARSTGWLKEDGRFIPHPASWLNARRWEDEPTLTPAAGKPPASRSNPMVDLEYLSSLPVG
jgi:hypothetical protein